MFCVLCGDEIVKDKHAVPIDIELKVYACSVECKEEYERRQKILDELTQLGQEQGLYD